MIEPPPPPPPEEEEPIIEVEVEVDAGELLEEIEDAAEELPALPE